MRLNGKKKWWCLSQSQSNEGIICLSGKAKQAKHECNRHGLFKLTNTWNINWYCILTFHLDQAIHNSSLLGIGWDVVQVFNFQNPNFFIASANMVLVQLSTTKEQTYPRIAF